jgi:hypothetical protein
MLLNFILQNLKLEISSIGTNIIIKPLLRGYKVITETRRQVPSAKFKFSSWKELGEKSRKV